MSEYSCTACQDLRDNAPEFVQNGVTDTVCESLHNNTGFNPTLKVLHDNEEDLHDANDCLIGVKVDQVMAQDVCDWRPFMKKVLGNLYELLKAIICAMSGIWSSLEIVSYNGIMKLYTDTYTTYSGTVSINTEQKPAFNHSKRSGNMPSSVLTAPAGFTSIKVKNTLKVPILVNTTFNTSIATAQNFACCYIVVTRDGNKIGQTPFIVPNTYDQQVIAEPFILAPGGETVLSYYFAVGQKNVWFMNTFGKSDGSAVSQNDLDHPDTRCALDSYSGGTSVQGSYFIVQATTFIE